MPHLLLTLSRAIRIRLYESLLPHSSTAVLPLPPAYPIGASNNRGISFASTMHVDRETVDSRRAFEPFIKARHRMLRSNRSKRSTAALRSSGSQISTLKRSGESFGLSLCCRWIKTPNLCMASVFLTLTSASLQRENDIGGHTEKYFLTCGVTIFFRPSSGSSRSSRSKSCPEPIEGFHRCASFKTFHESWSPSCLASFEVAGYLHSRAWRASRRPVLDGPCSIA